MCNSILQALAPQAQAQAVETGQALMSRRPPYNIFRVEHSDSDLQAAFSVVFRQVAQGIIMNGAFHKSSI